MEQLSKEVIEKIYAGWLAKIIGIRLGAPVEGWSYERIKNLYGALDHYPVDYQRFAADDDSNGPLFFLRALEDSGREAGELEAEDVAEALLNYAPFEHGFFWWGGYGCSTEHTAYLNLRAGIPAPRSGSVEQNGSTMAEQIGGQIFIDTWGLVTPGNPDRAADYARKAASVTHGGDGVWGGVFIAACISYAFVEQDIPTIIEKGLSYLPAESGYARVVREVMRYHASNPGDWESCHRSIRENHGYDKYPGNCHIIPNIAVMILALLYGGGDFSDTINICNRCGWDTDCNVGNVATIMGVRGGLGAIERKWREPIGDFLACSSVVGSLNIQDIPYGACYIAGLAAKIAGLELPEPYRAIVETRIDSCHFEFPGSTHALAIRVEALDEPTNQTPEFMLENTGEAAHTGERSLRIAARPVAAGQRVFVYKQTHFGPSDFHDSRYDPAFSPLLYPGQTIHGSALLPAYGKSCTVRLYARNARTRELYLGEQVSLEPGVWAELAYTIPAMDGVLLDEAGFQFALTGEERNAELAALVDDLYFDGQPCYSIDFAQETTALWSPVHREVSQFTRLKGHFYLEGGKANLSCSDFGEVYTGHHDWKDYAVTAKLRPVTGEYHCVNFRVQGGVRSYAAGLLPGSKLGIVKNTRRGQRVLAQADFAWETGRKYDIRVSAKGSSIELQVEGCSVSVVDAENPYRQGCVGLSVRDGSRLQCSALAVLAGADELTAE